MNDQKKLRQRVEKDAREMIKISTRLLGYTALLISPSSQTPKRKQSRRKKCLMKRARRRIAIEN